MFVNNKMAVQFGLLVVVCVVLFTSNSVVEVKGDKYLEFFPLWKGSIPANGSSVSWESPCFNEVTAQMTSFSSSSGADFVVTTSSPRSDLCSDLYLITTDESFLPFWNLRKGDHPFSIPKWKSTDEEAYVAANGIQVFLIQDGALGFLEDLIATYELFFSKSKSETDQIQFLKDYMNITLIPRASGVPTKVIPDPSEILSGDCLQLFKFGELHGGINVIEAYGTGGRADHVAAFLWMDSELYVVESMGGGGGGSQGIIKTPYEDWMNALDPQWLVSLLRLTPEKQALFNVTAAIEFFLSVEGLPYGLHNYFFGWVDTVADNYPPPLSQELIPVVMALADRIDYPLSAKMWGEALNFRMNTTNLRIDDLVALSYSLNISFYDVMTWPEQDSWTYSDGKSLTCSSFATAMYKAAGVFPGIDFQATELTPRDSYSLTIFATQSEWQQPTVCSQDPFNSENKGWCQISGSYIFELPEFNTVDPFSNMFQKCGGLPVDYVRAPGC